MGRAKMNMELIKKLKARKSTYKKRKEGLIKKMHEFTTLCDVDACMIIYPSENDVVPYQVWPPNNPVMVKRLIDIFKSKRMDGGSGTNYRTYGVVDFLQEKNRKMAEELQNLRKKNFEKKLLTWYDFMDDLPQIQLRNFADLLTDKIAIMKNRLDFFNKANHPQNLKENPLHFGKFSYENVSYQPVYPVWSHQPPFPPQYIQSGKELEVVTNQHFNHPMVQMPGPNDQLEMMHYQNQVIEPNSMMMLLVNDNVHEDDEYTQCTIGGYDHEGSYERQFYYEPFGGGLLENIVYNNVKRQCVTKPEMMMALPPSDVPQSPMVMPPCFGPPDNLNGDDIRHALHGWI